MGRIKVGNYVLHDRGYTCFRTGVVICLFGDVVKIKTRDGDTFLCPVKGLRKILKNESESRDALQKLRS